MPRTVTPARIAGPSGIPKRFERHPGWVRAGYSERTANEQGAQLLKKPQIIFAIDAAKGERSKKAKIDAAWVLIRLDGPSKFAFVELHDKATTAVSREFLQRLIAADPYKIHTVLTDNGIQFTTPGAGARLSR